MQYSTYNNTVISKEAVEGSTNQVSTYCSGTEYNPINVPSDNDSDDHLPFTCMGDLKMWAAEPEIEDSVPMKEEEGRAFYRVVNLLEKVTIGPGGVEAVENLTRVVNQLSPDSN